MSVINQVLSQLEQRGAQTDAGQTSVRAVAHPRRDFMLPLMMIGLVLLAVIVVWQWLSPRNPVVTADAAVAKKHVDVVPIAPVISMPAENVSADLLVQASRESSESSSLPQSSPLKEDPEQELSSHNMSPSPSSETTAPVVVAEVPITKAKIVVPAVSSVVPIKKVSSSQLADAEFRRATSLMQLGRTGDAMAGYEAALRLDADHNAARQALVALLLEDKRNEDAEKVLLEGLSNKPERIEFIMLLARLQVERGALDQATETLQQSLQFAETQADYRAFLAALLQRQNRNEEAIKHYQVALQYVPGSGIWLMGYGISLQAMQRNVEAKDAFQRALDTKDLAPELQRFVQQKLKGL